MTLLCPSLDKQALSRSQSLRRKRSSCEVGAHKNNPLAGSGETLDQLLGQHRRKNHGWSSVNSSVSLRMSPIGDKASTAKDISTIWNCAGWQGATDVEISVRSKTLRAPRMLSASAVIVGTKETATGCWNYSSLVHRTGYARRSHSTAVSFQMPSHWHWRM